MRVQSRFKFFKFKIDDSLMVGRKRLGLT